MQLDYINVTTLDAGADNPQISPGVYMELGSSTNVSVHSYSYFTTKIRTKISHLHQLSNLT